MIADTAILRLCASEFSILSIVRFDKLTFATPSGSRHPLIITDESITNRIIFFSDIIQTHSKLYIYRFVIPYIKRYCMVTVGMIILFENPAEKVSCPQMKSFDSLI